jgi:hypothetical protein
MSQLVVCRDSQGVILAADSKAVIKGLGGEVTHLEVDRLLELSRHAAIAAGGAADGADMVGSLKEFVQQEGLVDVQEIYQAALPFLATEYEKFMRKQCDSHLLDPVHHVYFILGGYTEQSPQHPHRLYLLWAKRKLPRLDGDEIPFAYTAPRLMGVEYRLNKLCQENRPLEEILPEVRRGMAEQAGKNEEVGPPFKLMFITGEGVRDVSSSRDEPH